ncbi:MAG: Na+/H+ antiporter subunit E [Clostridiales bacterium]|nr:Na+/H+ antiporter subunit E [Clostridiales bacterium]
MKRLLKQFQLYILLMFFWMILNGNTDLQVLIYGTVFSVLIIKMTYHIMFELDDDILKLPPAWRFVWFGLIVVVSITRSSLQHVVRIMKNESSYTTFEVELTTKNIVIITLIANAITLTPGTITINVSDQTLSVVGFSKCPSDVEEMKAEIIGYQKPFLYRRR